MKLNGLISCAWVFLTLHFLANRESDYLISVSLVVFNVVFICSFNLYFINLNKGDTFIYLLISSLCSPHRSACLFLFFVELLIFFIFWDTKHSTQFPFYYMNCKYISLISDYFHLINDVFLQWADGSVVYMAYCSCRGTKFSFQYPHWLAPNYRNSGSRASDSLFGPWQELHTHPQAHRLIYTDA